MKKNYLNSHGLDPTIGLSKKKMKHTNPNDSTGNSALLLDWNRSTIGSASLVKDNEEDNSMVRPGGFVGDNETDDLEHKSLLGFKGGKKAVVGHFKIIVDCYPDLGSLAVVQHQNI